MTQRRCRLAHQSSVLAGFAIAVALGTAPHVLAQGGDASRPVSLAPPTAQRSSPLVQWPKIAVKLVLTGTLIDSATGVPQASTGGAFSVGEFGSMSVNSGASDDLCGPRFGAGSPFAESAYAWRVDVNPIAVSNENITIAIDWTRSDRNASGERETRAGDKRTVTLKDGERHVLDFVSAPRENRSRCANLSVQVEASLADDPAFANASIGYDVWLIDQDAAGRETTRRLQAVAGQGEALPLTFLPFGWTSDGGPAGDPWRPDVAVSITGSSIKGRVRADGQVQLLVAADRWVRTGTSHGTSGYGEKRFTAKPGEIVRLEIPASSGGTSFLASHKTFLTVVVHVQ